MFHLALFSSSIASATANQQVTQVTDNLIAPSASGFLVPMTINKLMRAAGVGNLIQRFQLSSPSLKKFTPFDGNPGNTGTLISSPARALHFEKNPIPLSVNEELDAFITNSGAGATQTTVAAWFCDGPIAPVTGGQVFSVHWTASTTLTANAWTSFAITLDNGLPSGTFAIVGSRMKSAGALFHRFIPRGGAPYRPGTFAQQAFTDYGLDMDRYGGIGEYLRFTNTTPPQVEVFSLSADTTEDGFLDLIQVG